MSIRGATLVTPRPPRERNTGAPGRNLGLDLVRVTEAAALAAGRWMGRSQKEVCDAAAVRAMRLILADVDMDGVVVIGEGEKDEAPMLFNGELVGTGRGPRVDIAVDPIDGTSLLANGRPDAIAVIAAAPRGAMWSPGAALYMMKLVVGRDARDAVAQQVLTAEDLVRSEDVFFAATGITDGVLLSGVRYSGNGAATESIVIRGRSGTRRTLHAQHRLDKLMAISPVEY